jgi:hypothetical protein
MNVKESGVYHCNTVTLILEEERDGEEAGMALFGVP